MSHPRYQEVVEYLFRQLPMFQNIGKGAFKKDLTNILKLCAHLGQPQDAFPCIHIAGTNGKGSTTHILAALLQSKYKKVGIYTSPHFVDYRERIKIGRNLISESDVVEFVDLVQEQIKLIQPSFFEITVAMSFWYFKKEKVDIAIIETGLGGRLDSTNVINPVMSMITNIGFDHMEFLGETLQEIAREKAGIIKENTAVLIGKRQTETTLIFNNFAKKANAHIQWADDSLEIHSEGVLEGRHQYILDLKGGGTLKFTTDLLPDYQKENIALALCGFFQLFPKDAATESFELIARNALNDVTKNLGFYGRWQIISESPKIILDGGHNSEGWTAIARQLEKTTYNRLIIVIGVVKDKDLKRYLTILPNNATYIACKATIPRAMTSQDLAEQLLEAGKSVKISDSVSAALSLARTIAQASDLILVTGSMYVVAEALS